MKRKIWRIDTSIMDEKQLETVLYVIEKYSNSSAVNKSKQYETEDQTLQGATDFLTLLAQRAENWKLLSFYSKLFLFAEKTRYLKFYGSGTRGFSIKLEVIGKGEISLCTIYKNKNIEFSLKR